MSSSVTIATNADADAFLRKYLTQPTDITARLVFADWLEETGQSHNMAWAYYIRLKAEADHYDFESAERRKLERQAEEYVPKIRANLTIPAKLFDGYPKSLLQLLPPANITVKLGSFKVPLAILDLMPESLAREHLALPLQLQGNTLLVTTVNPRDTDFQQKLEFILNKDVVLVRGEQEEIIEAINLYYGQIEVETVDVMLVEFADTERPYIQLNPDIDPGDDDAPIIRLTNLILTEAANRRADRILIFPGPDRALVRYRIDDEWTDRDRLPLRLLRPLAARLALAAGIPVESTFQNPPTYNPITGEFPLQVNGIRVRVTIQPSPDGPTVQIDILQP